MAVAKKTKENDHFGLPHDIVIDVVAIQGEKVIVKSMTYGESLSIKKAKGWIYHNYQKGFHSFKNTN